MENQEKDKIRLPLPLIILMLVTMSGLISYIFINQYNELKGGQADAKERISLTDSRVTKLEENYAVISGNLKVVSEQQASMIKSIDKIVDYLNIYRQR